MSKTPEETWLSIPEKHRISIVNSCWCSQCLDSVTIIDYVVKAEKGTLVLDGSCHQCQAKVVRVID